MLELRYVGEDTVYKVLSFKNINDHVVMLADLGVAETKGFTLSREGMKDDWDYSAFTTIYDQNGDDVYFSNDGSVKPEPTPEPQPEPQPEPLPTIDEIRQAKISEMNSVQQKTIDHGVTVNLSVGTERFTLTSHDQESLLGLQTMVAQGIQQIPWHNADHDQACKYYSLADMTKIINASLTFITYHVTFFRDLRIYINSLTNKDKIESLTYELSSLPVAYRSQVLQDLINQMNL